MASVEQGILAAAPSASPALFSTPGAAAMAALATPPGRASRPLPAAIITPPPGLEDLVPTPPMLLTPPSSRPPSSTNAAQGAMRVSALLAAHNFRFEDGSSSETCSTADTEPRLLTPTFSRDEALEATRAGVPRVLALETAVPGQPLADLPLTDLPSVGSVGHGSGRCKPCAFLFKEGCQNGTACQFCHLCDEDERKRRKQQRATQNKLHREARATRAKQRQEEVDQYSGLLASVALAAMPTLQAAR